MDKKRSKAPRTRCKFEFRWRLRNFESPPGNTHFGNSFFSQCPNFLQGCGKNGVPVEPHSPPASRFSECSHQWETQLVSYRKGLGNFMKAASSGCDVSSRAHSLCPPRKSSPWRLWVGGKRAVSGVFREATPSDLSVVSMTSGRTGTHGFCFSFFFSFH